MTQIYWIRCMKRFWILHLTFHWVTHITHISCGFKCVSSCKMFALQTAFTNRHSTSKSSIAQTKKHTCVAMYYSTHIQRHIDSVDCIELIIAIIACGNDENTWQLISVDSCQNANVTDLNVLISRFYLRFHSCLCSLGDYWVAKDFSAGEILS